MRERLERPVSSRDSFEWRLRGAVGPTVLADAFVKEASLNGEANFYLAELALTLSRVNPDRAAEGGLKSAVVEELLDEVVAELKQRSLSLSTVGVAAPLNAYVSAAFERAARA
jgi:hypothetical protein